MERADIPTISRRHALAAAGGVAAGLALGPAARPAFGAAPATDADAIVVGAGLAGLVATAELIAAGPQGAAAGPGARGQPGRAGVLVVRRAVLRRLRRAAPDGHQGLLRSGLAGLAGRGRVRPRRRRPGRRGLLGGTSGRRPTCEFAAGEKRSWLAGLGMQWLPSGRLGRARRRQRRRARQLGAAIPRHLGHRPGVMEPFEKKVRAGVAAGKVIFKFRHRVDGSSPRAAPSPACAGAVLEPSSAARGTPSSRDGGRRFRAARPGVDRDLRRHRRQPGPDPAELAGPARPAAADP